MRLAPDTSLAQFETTQLFFTSKDGTRVPMFITARRGIKLDGSHPTLLVGEGAFNVPATPIFSAEAAAWLRLGGIYAVANVRGGGEYGRAWHVAATGMKKQVSFDDFISSAEFLISQRYTRSSSLAIAGRGAGGLLVGAAITQRPELFGAALIDAGILDMTRFSRFTIGAAWMPEFGSPDRPSDLRALLAYSPLQSVKPDVRYPPVLVTVGDHDDAVTPAHSYKFAAALQAIGGEFGAGVASRRLRRGLRARHPDRQTARTRHRPARVSRRCAARRALILYAHEHACDVRDWSWPEFAWGCSTRESSWP